MVHNKIGTKISRLSVCLSVSRLVWLRSLVLLVFCCISLAVLSYMFLFLVIMDYRLSGILSTVHFTRREYCFGLSH